MFLRRARSRVRIYGVISCSRYGKPTQPNRTRGVHHLGKLPRNRICLKFGQGEVGHYFLLDIFQQLSGLPLDASSNLFPNSYFFLIEFLHWLSENYTWVFSGVGVSALAVAVWFLREYVFRKPNVLGVRQSNAVNKVRVVTFIELTAKSHPPSSIRLCGLSI